MDLSSSTVMITGAILFTSTVAVMYLLMSRKSMNPVTLVENMTKYALPLAEKIVITHNTRKFRFRLPSENHVLGLPAGQHVYLSAKIDGKLVVRPYTPVSSDDDLGYVDLIIKLGLPVMVYLRGIHPKFPDGGKMSQHLEQMKIGETVDFRGPAGPFIYNGNGKFTIRKDKKTPPQERVFETLSMIAGGSGITPMLQIISAVLKNGDDKTQISLLFANHTEDDILCRKELDELALKHRDRFNVWYTVGRPPVNWVFSSGRVDDEMIKRHLFAPSDNSAVLLCGPPPMINRACIPSLDKLGYDSGNIFLF
ncbi:oxidoreductase, FAD-binding protein [Ancylostoma caninum]|uniref:NADH-cytochrome b5 reductase n=1 Tax=Ancylostoma caninum TaxID=29170 RepID=A0A368H3C7_ANCCA|nr:oxidoreductase, FAD-binding protein [Ancylostoma caninum]